MNVVVSDWAFREVFADEARAEAAMLAADADPTVSEGGTLTFGCAREGKLGRWSYVTVRRRGTHELVGYLGPAADLS